uniref:Nucleoporin 50 n=1 Tax=Petromyzon marinus TaxID=7757 RepID=S4RWP9_PETMA
MAKRIADRELNDRNWNDEDDVEEAGSFSVANEDVLKGRAIKKARRRVGGDTSESAKTTFKGFGGLVTSSASGFGSLSSGFGGFKPLAGLANGSTVASSALPTTPSMSAATNTQTALAQAAGKGSPKTGSSTADASQSTALAYSSHSDHSGSGSEKGTYNHQLRSLNYSVRDWIVKHVNGNPLCDLTPVFRDYERHLADIDQKYSGESGSDSDGAAKLSRNAESPKAAPLSFQGLQAANATAGSTTASNSRQSSAASFAISGKSAAPLAGSATFSFVKTSAKAPFGTASATGNPALPTFTFTNAGFGSSPAVPGFSFSASSVQKPLAQESEEQDGEDEEPPKPVVNEVKESDAFYSTKCKLFYKKGEEFKEKGVGMLHLKPMENKKTQLLIRADTSLGNILLNVLLQPSMVCTRTGKNVLLMCVPNPPVDEGSKDAVVPMLIRVKTGEDADELHRAIGDKKGS